MFKYSSIGLLTTLSINYYNRMIFNMPLKIFGIFIGMSCGSIYGLL